MYVTVKVEVPKNLNAKQKEALEAFAEVTGEEAHSEGRNFGKK